MIKPLHISFFIYGILLGCGTAFVEEAVAQNRAFVQLHGGIDRGDTASRQLALVFTGDEFGDGVAFIANALKKEQVSASFFLTGNFYRNKAYKKLIGQLKQDGNYLGSHSDRHLLYCDWGNRDSLLVTRAQFEKDINDSYAELKKFGIDKEQSRYFLPPYEWYNQAIATWTAEMGLQLVNFTPGTRSAADYTYPEMGTKYINSEKVLASILNYEQKDKNGLNGFMLLLHIGTDPRRKDKFYGRLPELIQILKDKGYQFVRVDELLGQEPAGIPETYLKDSLPALVAKCKNLLDRAYMAQTLIAETDTLPGWEGFPVKLYEYKTGKDRYTGQPKTGKVYLLNPSAEKLASWIISTCWEVKKSLDAKYVDKVFQTVRGQSGAQFPVKGVVYEDQYTPDFQEPYVFKDGVTVYVADSTMFPKDKTCTPEQLDFYLKLENKDLKPQTGRYGRIISTTREMYLGNGGREDVGDAGNRKLKWLEVVKELYKRAWRSDKNELMIAWARQNL